MTPRRIRLGVVRGISHGLFGPPDDFTTPARGLGARLVRVYVYWSQVEPVRGRYDWRIVDDILAQLDGDEDAWITVCSSSRWATRSSTDFQPPSPALDDEAYVAFVSALVRRCAGRVRYWQCNNEPSNTDLLWAGTAAEYVQQLRLFAAAVRRADPSASVVLGGCGYDVLSSPPGSRERAFFDQLAAEGRDSFDLFDVHLYDDPEAIPDHIDTARGFMRAHGYAAPVVVGEYGGPTIFQFPAASAALERAFVDVLTAGPVSMSTDDLAASVAQESPDRRAVRRLYERRDDLPTELAMFLADAPAGLVGLRERLGCRQLVQQALLALACGVDVLACWNLAPEVANHVDRLNAMDLMFGSLALMDHEGGAIRSLRPRARTHRLLAAVLADATDVRLHQAEADATLVRIDNSRLGPVVAVWTRAADPLDESGAESRITVDWPHERLHALDVHGRRVRPRLAGGRAHVTAGSTPLLLSGVPLPGG